MAADINLDPEYLQGAKNSYGKLMVEKLEAALNTIESFTRDAKNTVKRVRKAVENNEPVADWQMEVDQVGHAVTWMAANAESSTSTAQVYFREYLILAKLLELATEKSEQDGK